MARRARQRLAPTGWGDASPVGHLGTTAGGSPCSVGVRRCLTRRPARAGGPAPMVTAVVLSIVVRAAGHVELPRHAARAGEAAPRPYRVGRCVPGRADGRHGGATSPPCRGRAVPDSPGPRNRRDPACVKHNGCNPSGDCCRGIAPGGLDGLARTLVDCARCRTGGRTRPGPGRSERRPRGWPRVRARGRERDWERRGAPREGRGAAATAAEARAGSRPRARGERVEERRLAGRSGWCGCVVDVLTRR